MATHGTAPDIAGKGLANPWFLLLSAVMLLNYLSWTEVAKTLENAITTAIKNQQIPSDFASSLGTPDLSTKDCCQMLMANLTA